MNRCSAPQNDRLNFSFVKDIHVVGKEMSRKGRKSLVSRKVQESGKSKIIPCDSIKYISY